MLTVNFTILSYVNKEEDYKAGHSNCWHSLTIVHLCSDSNSIHTLLDSANVGGPSTSVTRMLAHPRVKSPALHRFLS